MPAFGPLAGNAVVSLPGGTFILIADFGTFTETGEVVTFQIQEVDGVGSFALTGETLTIFFTGGPLSFGSFIWIGFPSSISRVLRRSNKDYSDMAVLAYDGNTKLLQDTGDTEGFFYLVPPNLFWISALQAIPIYSAMPNKIFNPFFGVSWVNGPPQFSDSI